MQKLTDSLGGEARVNDFMRRESKRRVEANWVKSGAPPRREDRPEVRGRKVVALTDGLGPAEAEEEEAVEVEVDVEAIVDVEETADSLPESSSESSMTVWAGFLLALLTLALTVFCLAGQESA
jgi:hypothetical protein